MNLKEKYNKEIKAKLKDEFGYQNTMEIPKITKIIINSGVGRASQDAKALDLIEDRIMLITAQKAVRTKAKHSIAGFKLREKMPIGVKVTLRGKRMYDFIEKLALITIPRIRDFRGINKNAFDGKGNYSLGIKDHTVFPETPLEDQGQSFGFQINFVTTAKTNAETKRLLEELGFIFKK